jgi:hypothetical protein
MNKILNQTPRKIYRWQAGWDDMPVILALRRWRHEEHEFKASQATKRTCLKNIGRCRWQVYE